MKKALITGITGQDGSYLAEFLLAKGYEVHGFVRRASTFNRGRIDHLFEPRAHDKHQELLHLHYADLSDSSSLGRILRLVRPDEIYNLGAQSHVKVSFDLAEYTANTTGLGLLRLLEAIRELDLKPKIYQAGSSEVFGKSNGEVPQNEETAFYPRSPYGAAKAFAHWIAVNYRESYGMFICNGLLFNHESPRRGENFVTRKISLGVARIKLGLQDKLYLGNLEAKRDWGYARDYVDAMWRMLQRAVPDDYVIATGETHTIREFCEAAFAQVDLDYREFVRVDPKYFRPTEIDVLIGDSSKAKRLLEWTPRVKFKELVKIMVEADLQAVKRQMLPEVPARPIENWTEGVP